MEVYLCRVLYGTIVAVTESESNDITRRTAEQRSSAAPSLLLRTY
jgi:hypothetical protein